MESQLRLDSIIVAQQTTDSQVIGWTLLGVGPAAVGAVIRIFRSYAPNDGFDLIAVVYANTGFYRDDTVNLYDLWRVPYYKLEILDSLGHTRTYGPHRVSESLDGIAISLIRNTNIAIRLGGSPILIYMRKSGDADRCLMCWDAKLRKVTQSSCEYCYNTGFDGGYFDPIMTLAVIPPEAKRNAPGDMMRQMATTAALMSNYPVVRPRDLIYEIDTGKRFRITGVETAEKQRMLINQNVSLEALVPGDVEHRLPVPPIASLTPVLSRSTAPHRTFVVDNFSPENPTIGRIHI